MAIFTESGKAVAPVNLDGTPMADVASDTNDNGAKEQEVTDPASDPDTEEGAEEQEVAEPADAEASPEAAPEAEGQVETEEPKQSKAENRRRAAERRAAEREQMRTEIADGIVKQLRITNPATGKPFESYAEFEQGQNAERTSKVREQLEAAGVDPALIDELVTQNPAVAAADKAIANAEERETVAQKKVDSVSFDKLLADVASVVPGIETAEDLFGWEMYDEFRLLVSGGKDPLHAAKVLSGGATADAAKQAAMNEIASKSHLTRTNTRRSSGGDYGISDVQYANMLAMNPGLTRKEAAAYVKKYGG